MVPVRGRVWSNAGLVLALCAFQSALVLCERQHPFIFMSSLDVANVRLQAEGNRAATGARLREAVASMLARPAHFLPPEDPDDYGARWNEHYGNNIVPLALYCTLWPNDTQAQDMLRTYSDRMAAASENWYVRSAPEDDIPVCHSLTGFVTMFDFTYHQLDTARQASYLTVITTYGKRLYSLAVRKASWTRQYIHNHSPTVLLALQMAAIVGDAHKLKEAKIWYRKAFEIFEQNLRVLRLVVDGSLNEGVTYGSYTSRSILLFAALHKRAFPTTTILDNPWFAKHFDFLRYTILPGYKETVGIGDASPTWFYGPESQLHFLDRFILQTGQANWLAARIRENRSKKGRLAQAEGHKWSTLHSELIWFNPSWGERPLNSRPRLHVFSDWGVAVYGGCTPSGNTFLSFKCGVYHGRAALRLVSRPLWGFINGWKSFNAGHEQPDQGSFVFYPRGKPFITEALYGPKMTHFNNVLLFSPSLSPDHCTAPLQGQLGAECTQWLKYMDPEVVAMTADITTATEEHGMVLMHGEYSSAYSRHLGLNSVQRALLMITADVLLVVDTITLRSISKLVHGHAFFHNNRFPFKLADDGQSASVDVDGEVHQVTWDASPDVTVSVSTGQATFKAEYGKRSTNFLNATFPVSKQSPQHLAWLFCAAGTSTSGLRFSATKKQGVSVQVTINGVKYSVHLSTQPSDARSRVEWVGSPAMARVDVGTSSHHFGVGLAQFSLDNQPLLQSPEVAAAVKGWSNLTGFRLLLLIIATSGLLLAAMSGRYYQRWKRTAPRQLQKVIIVSLVGMLTWLLVSQLLYMVAGLNTSLASRDIAVSGTGSEGQGLPDIFITSLPGSGAEILQDVLSTSADVRNFSLDLLPPASLEPLHMLFGHGHVTSCVSSPALESSEFLKTWLDTVMQQPSTYVSNAVAGSVKKRQQLRELAEELEQKANAATAIIDSTGGWNSKVELLGSLLGRTGRVVLVLRDPKSWVAYHMAKQLKNPAYPYIQNLFRELQPTDAGNVQRECAMPKEFDLLQEELAKEESLILDAPERFLALVWAVNTQLALGDVASGSAVWVDSPSDRHFILVMEKFLEAPEESLVVLFRWLGLPLRPVTTHRLLSLANTGFFKVAPYESVAQSNWTLAGRMLPTSQLHEVETITHDVSRRLETFHGNVYLPLRAEDRL